MIRQMFDLMYEHRGIGLAGNQVGLPYRVCVLNVTGDPAEKDAECVLINPVIMRRKGTAEDREGCLSFPEIFAPVRRCEQVVISAYGPNGQEVTLELSGLWARAAQHEIDHLDGVLFIDRLTPSNLLAIKESLLDLETEFRTNQRLGLIPRDEDIAQRLAELEMART